VASVVPAPLAAAAVAPTTPAVLPVAALVPVTSVLVAAPVIMVIMTGDPSTGGEDLCNLHERLPIDRSFCGSPGVSPGTLRKLAAWRIFGEYRLAARSMYTHSGDSQPIIKIKST
jgi:hypothetical protein